MTAKKIKAPGIFEVLPFHKGMTVQDLPDPAMPHYILEDSGMYMTRKIAIGTVVEKTYKKPEALGSMNLGTGIFWWEGEKIPAKLVSQATDYFRRIYNKHHTEAEVIITRHNETGEYRLFVPWQRANGGGVKSIFEPTHIHKDWLVVGTFHSHCHFSAYHSGTDSGDASDMDGIHFTIGMLQNDPPQIVAMVAVSKKEYHYKDVSVIADLDFKAATAPEWWDKFLLINPPKEMPKGFKTLEQKHWDEFLGLAIVKPKTTFTPQPHTPYKQPDGKTPYGEWKDGKFIPNPRPSTPSDWSSRQATPPNQHNWTPRVISGPEPAQMSKRQLKKLLRRQGLSKSTIVDRIRTGSVVWQPDGNGQYKPMPFDPTVPGFSIRRVDDIEGRVIDQALDIAYNANLIDISELEEMSPDEVGDMLHWQKFFSKKMIATQDALEALGLKVDVSTRVRTFREQTNKDKVPTTKFTPPTMEQIAELFKIAPDATLKINGKAVHIKELIAGTVDHEQTKLDDLTKDHDEIIMAPTSKTRGAHI